MTKSKKKEKEQKKEEAKEIKDPVVQQLVKNYQDIAFRWNQIASYSAGKSKLDESLSPEDHVNWLVKSYVHDVMFLLNQLGVVKNEITPDDLQETEKRTEAQEEKPQKVSKTKEK